jgi:uncharacterized OB-fold protein
MPRFPVQRDADTATFFDGTARGEFLLVRDLGTGVVHGPQFDPSSDPGRYEMFAASGDAEIVSWSVVHERIPDGGVRRTVVGIVQLSEGPWWWTEIVGVDPDSSLLGTSVKVAFDRPGDDGEIIPYFTAV